MSKKKKKKNKSKNRNKNNNINKNNNKPNYNTKNDFKNTTNYVASQDLYTLNLTNNDDGSNKNKNILKKLSFQKNISKERKIRNIIVLGSVAVLSLSSASFMCLNTSKLKDLSYNGIFIDNEHVGKLNKEELSEKLTNLLNNKISSTIITINGKNDSISFSPETLGLYYDIETLTNDILKYNKTDNNISNTINRISLNVKKHTIEYKPVVDEEKLDNYVETIAKKLSIPATNAIVTFGSDKITATQDKSGYTVDTLKLKEDLLACINSNFSENTTISLSYTEEKPTLTQTVAEKMQVLGTYKTKLPSKTGDRTGNIKLYTSKLNKSVLLPGEELSCDTAGGNRTWADGYRNAPGYVNGEVVPILAGGICQATSTIYNALLYADLEITERHPHSMPVTYAKLGLDAAIAKGVKDLKFKNNTENPIILQTYVDSNGYVVATIWGIPTVENKKVELFTKQYNSKQADAYKKIYIDGKLVSTEKISSNKYK